MYRVKDIRARALWASWALSTAAGALCLAAWPTFHGDYALRGAAESRLPDAPALVWRFDAGAPVEFTPVADGEHVVFIAGAAEILCLDLDGRERWRSRPLLNTGDRQRATLAASLLLADGMLVAVAEHGEVLALDAATGSERWRTALGARVAATANWSVDADGTGRVIVVTQAEGVVHALEPATGTPLWRSQPLDRCDGPPSCDRGLVVAGSCAAALHVLDARDGRERQRIALGTDAQVAGGVALEDGLAFTGNRSGTLVSADLLSGEVLWVSEAYGAEIFAAPVVADGKVIVLTEGGTVAALDRGDGAHLWKRKLPARAGTLALAADRIVVGADGSLHLLRLEDGAGLWSLRVSDRITGPALVQGLLLVGTDEGSVLAYGAAGERDKEAPHGDDRRR